MVSPELEDLPPGIAAFPPSRPLACPQAHAQFAAPVPTSCGPRPRPALQLTQRQPLPSWWAGGTGPGEVGRKRGCELVDRGGCADVKGDVPHAPALRRDRPPAARMDGRGRPQVLRARATAATAADPAAA